MQEQHPCMYVEYAPWAGVLISTNSTYPHGISRSRIFDRGAGGIVVSFYPDEVMRRCGNLDLRNGMLRVHLQLFAVPKDGSKVRNEVKFSICEDSENPRTLYNFAPVVFNIDKIAKSRSSGLSLSYDFYNFFFSASLMYNYVDGTTLFKITSLSATEKENRKGKKRGSHFATQSTHYHQDQNHVQSPTPQQAQVSQFLIHPQPPPTQPQPIMQPHIPSSSNPPPSQPQPIVQPPQRHSSQGPPGPSSQSLPLPSKSQSSPQTSPQLNPHHGSYSSYRTSFSPQYSPHSSHSSSRPTAHSSSHTPQWRYSNSRHPSPMHIAYTTPTTVPLLSPSNEVTIHVFGSGLSYCSCVYTKMDRQLTVARYFTNITNTEGEEMAVTFYHPLEPQLVTVFLCAEDATGIEFTVDFVGSRTEELEDGRRKTSYGARGLVELHNGRHSPPLSPPLSPISPRSAPPPLSHYVPSQTLRRYTKSQSSEPSLMITQLNSDRRRSRESPTADINSPPSKIARSSPPNSSSARPAPTSTNYHSLINRFISFLPQPTSRTDVVPPIDPLSPTISNHEVTSSILVPLYATLKINASTARTDHFLAFLSASCVRELLLVNKEVSNNFYFYSDTAPWRCFTPKRLISVTSLKTLTSHQVPITHLHFSDSFNSVVDAPLPPTLVQLAFGEEFNQPIETFPASLLHLSFGYGFNQTLELPLNLQFLSFGGYFNQTLRLPRTLIYLKFGFAFNQTITDFPPTLQYLAFGTHFNQPIANLPTSLVFLAVDPDYQLQLDNVPAGVLKYSRKVTRGEIDFYASPPQVRRFYRELRVGEYRIEYVSPSRIILERPGKLTSVMLVGTGITQSTKAFIQLYDQSYQVNISFTRDFGSPDQVLASVYL